MKEFITHRGIAKWDFNKVPGDRPGKRERCLSFAEITEALNLPANTVRSLIGERGIKPVFQRTPHLYHLSDFKRELAANPDVKPRKSTRREELEVLLAGMAPGDSALITDRDQNLIANIVRDSKYTLRTRRDGEARRVWLIAKPKEQETEDDTANMA